MAVYPVKLQIVLVLTTFDLSSKFRVAGIVKERANGHLNADPILLPIPDGAPAEFPSIIIKDENSKWSFQLAPARFDLVVDYGRPKSIQPLGETLHLLTGVAISIWDACQSEFGARANRIGIVTTFVEEIADAPETFRRRYLSEPFGNDATENHFYTVKKLTTGQFAINSLVKITGIQTNEGGPSRIVTEVDLNTVPEKPIAVDSNAIAAFRDVTATLAESVYLLYGQK